MRFQTTHFEPAMIRAVLEYRKHVAQNIIREFEINRWLVIAGSTGMKLHEFYDLELYEQDAVYEAVTTQIEEQNKQHQKTMSSLTDNLNSLKDSSSPAGISQPKFQFD